MPSPLDVGWNAADNQYFDANGNPIVQTPALGTMPMPATNTSPAAGTGGLAGGGASSTAASSALTSSQSDALARLNAILNQYGLGSLSEWVRQKLIDGASEAQIALELYDQPAFQQRFPAVAARRAAGLNPLSPAEILGYETQVSQLVHMAGLPASFASHDYVQNLLANDVSVAEISARIEQGYLKVSEADPLVREAFQRYFGVNGDNAIAALFLDPSKALPELEKMAQTAYVGGIGMKFNVNLGQSKAKEIADTGLSEAAIWQGYRQLDSLSPLFEETLGEHVDYTKEQEGVGAVFGITPGAETALDGRRRTRVNSFAGSGGGAYTGQSGVTGLGVADH